MTETFCLLIPIFTLLLCLPASHGRGHTFSHCLTDSDCVGDRTCLEAWSGISSPCLNNGNYCLCVPTDVFNLTCNNNSDCDHAENCMDVLTTLLNAPSFREGLCVDKSQQPYFENRQPCQIHLDCPPHTACMNITTFPYCGGTITELPKQKNTKSTTEGGDACISALALANLPKTLLRYSEHKRAAVLCDKNGSCATPGHLILYHGKTMMMRSYCGIVKCRNDVMDVNSPRYQRALRIRSNTNNLEFLSFAARYGSRVEEKMFEIAVRLGL